MSYEENKLMNLKDGRLLLKTLDEHKAEVDGYYESMTVGNAEQLVATVGVEDKVPYNFRTAGGTADIGDRLVDKLVGGTVCWNQVALPVNKNTSSTYGISTTMTNNKIIITGTPTVSGGAWRLDNGNVLIPENHVVLLNARTPHFNFRLQGEAQYSTKTKGYFIQKTGTDWQKNVVIQMESMDVTQSYDESCYIQLFDLTQMFGSTIADYILSLETATAGEGIAWFKKLFPKDYYEYNAGELMSVKAASHITRGFNAWDEEWEEGFWNTTTGEKDAWANHIRFKNYMPILPNTTYYKKCPASSFAWHLYYDANKNYIGSVSVSANTSFTTPANAYFMTSYTETGYGSVYKNDLCINLSWDGERDGEYEPYVEHNYPLDDSLELRGIPKLDSSNELYYDGDEYESDGTVNRKYGIVDLGTLTWSAWNPDESLVFNASLPGKKNQRAIADCVCAKYKYNGAIKLWSDLKDKEMTGNIQNDKIYIRNNDYSDNASFKTAMSGVYLVYELAEPTTESADPYQNPQIVDDFGTEEYIDAGVIAEERDVAIPVGHETTYQTNLRAKLEMSPDSPSGGDGDYIVRQTNGTNEYVKLVIPTELPANPGTDGTYVLKATVSNGTTTLSWEETE